MVCNAPELVRVFPYHPDLPTIFSYQDVVAATEKARATVYTIIPGLRFLGLSPEEAMAQGRLYYLKS